MTNENQSTLSKTCASCGLQKPLSAFLQITATAGASYGNICSVCRKAGLGVKSTRIESDDSTTSISGNKIDAKTKIHSDIDKKQEKDRITEEYHEDRKDTEITETTKLERNESAIQDEKKHRKEYIAKRSFLSGTRQFDTKTTTPTQVNQTQQNIDANVKQTQTNTTLTNTEKEFKEHQKITQNDFSVPYFDAQVTGEIRKQGDAYLRFRQFLGKNNSPILTNLEKIAKNADSAKADNTPTLENDKSHKPGSKRR